MNDPIVASNLSVHYGRKPALKSLDLTVPAGCVYALLGENGAGKTTFIKALTGYLEPADGQVSVLGMDPKSQSVELRRRIGYVSDAPPLYDWMSVEQIGWFAASFYPPPYFDRYRQLITDYKLPPGQKIKSLSKGQRAKVALSLATAHEPELLILDEPTSGLDPLVRREFMESMVEVASAGRTVLLSSHQLDEVARVSESVAIIHEGRLQLAGRLEDLKRQTHEVIITLVDPLVELAEPEGATVMQERRSGRQLRWLLRGWGDAIGRQIESAAGVLSVTSHQVTLDDLYAACVRPGNI